MVFGILKGNFVYAVFRQKFMEASKSTTWFTNDDLLLVEISNVAFKQKIWNQQNNFFIIFCIVQAPSILPLF